MDVKIILGDAIFILINTACVVYTYKQGKDLKKDFEWSFSKVLLVFLGIIFAPFVSGLIYSFIGAEDLWNAWIAVSVACCLSFIIAMVFEKKDLLKR